MAQEPSNPSLGPSCNLNRTIRRGKANQVNSDRRRRYTLSKCMTCLGRHSKSAASGHLARVSFENAESSLHTNAREVRLLPVHTANDKTNVQRSLAFPSEPQSNRSKQTPKRWLQVDSVRATVPGHGARFCRCRSKILLQPSYNQGYRVPFRLLQVQSLQQS